MPLVHQFLGYQSGLLAGGRVRYEVLEGPVELPADAVPGSFENERFTQVINSSPRESETDRSTVEEFVNRFGLKPTAETQVEVAAVPEEQTAAGSELIKGEFWHWLAMILVAGLVVEGLVANRTTA